MNNIKLTYNNDLTEDTDLSSLAVSEEPTDEDFLFTSQGDQFVPISNPELAYLATTSKISLSNIPNSAVVHLVTDGFQTIAFSSGMRKISPTGINNWGVPPFTEDSMPETLISGNFTNSMIWELSRPSKIFGFELMPNLFGTFTYRVNFFSGTILTGSITRIITVPGPPIGPATQGARLFAAITDGPGFDRIEITSLSGNTLGFLVAQVRYQGCVTLCNVIIKDTVTKETTIPVNCCSNLPGYEVISVSNDIKARIISTCCEIHEDFICPDFGLIAGVKTADVKIIAELLIPVTIQANGCTPITLPFTCVECVVFPIDNVFVSSEIKNCEVINVTHLVGSDFKVAPTAPGSPHCCVVGFASITARVSACVMTNSIEVSKCP
ncbi:MAG: hypothetical protein ACYDEX_02630 [Mobilitalea sp.]